MESNDGWITAAEALALLKRAFSTYEAQMAICKRARNGMVRAHAQRLVIGGTTRDNVPVPKDFWWAEGQSSLHADWTAGDFDTWTPDQQTHVRAFGVSFLRADIERMLPPIKSDTDSPNDNRAKPPARRAISNKVFVVHGHDDGPKEAVARFLSEIGLDSIILHERPNKGRTIITKFREEAADVGFAVVVMTPDDLGRATDETSDNPRARQNVVLELGFFIGALGPEYVAALVKGTVEKPSDFDGVVYISLDKDDWRAKLGQELVEAGYAIDWNKVMRKR